MEQEILDTLHESFKKIKERLAAWRLSTVAIPAQKEIAAPLVPLAHKVLQVPWS